MHVKIMSIICYNRVTGLKCLFLTADKLLNKMEDLQMTVAAGEPAIVIATEVIPKAQKQPIQEPLLDIDGFEKYTNFAFTEENLENPIDEELQFLSIRSLRLR